MNQFMENAREIIFGNMCDEQLYSNAMRGERKRNGNGNVNSIRNSISNSISNNISNSISNNISNNISINNDNNINVKKDIKE